MNAACQGCGSSRKLVPGDVRVDGRWMHVCHPCLGELRTAAEQNLMEIDTHTPPEARQSLQDARKAAKP